VLEDIKRKALGKQSTAKEPEKLPQNRGAADKDAEIDREADFEQPSLEQLYC